MRSKILSSILALALLLVGVPARSATSLADLELQKSVGRIVFELPKINWDTGERDVKGTSAGELIATAWAVDENHLITAGHVCSGIQSAAVDWRIPDRARVELIDDKDEIKKISVTVRLLDPVHDLCALWAPKHGLKPLKLADYTNVRRLQNIRVVGAPLGEYPAARDCYVSSKNSSDQKSEFLRNRLMASCDILPGYSGGPIIDEDGFVVGVVSGGFFAIVPVLPSFMMYGATSAQLKGFLTRLK